MPKLRITAPLNVDKGGGKIDLTYQLDCHDEDEVDDEDEDEDDDDEAVVKNVN